MAGRGCHSNSLRFTVTGKKERREGSIKAQNKSRSEREVVEKEGRTSTST
jgi:hypothetical protein